MSVLRDNSMLHLIYWLQSLGEQECAHTILLQGTKYSQLLINNLVYRTASSHKKRAYLPNTWETTKHFFYHMKLNNHFSTLIYVSVTASTQTWGFTISVPRMTAQKASEPLSSSRIYTNMDLYFNGKMIDRRLKECFTWNYKISHQII
jgi:hypothetical protein